jgi:hypothetical protein
MAQRSAVGGRQATTAGGRELSWALPVHRVSVKAMNALAVFGTAAALASPLQSFLRAYLSSTTLFREVFFWRLRRDLRSR